MAERSWEAELRDSIRDELTYLCEPSIRPTNSEERREFIKLAQTGYISLNFDSRIDRIPWSHFPGRLVADLIRLEARYASLWGRFSEMADEEVPKLEREIARLKGKKSKKASDA